MESLQSQTIRRGRKGFRPGLQMPPQMHSIEKIREKLPATSKILDAIHAGFIEYCKGRVVVANVSHLKLDSHAQHPGDCCIKSGFVRGKDTFVVKVASGFPNNGSNTKGKLSNSQGALMVFSQKTGELRAVLDDGGELTVRIHSS